MYILKGNAPIHSCANYLHLTCITHFHVRLNIRHCCLLQLGAREVNQEQCCSPIVLLLMSHVFHFIGLINQMKVWKRNDFPSGSHIGSIHFLPVYRPYRRVFLLMLRPPQTLEKCQPNPSTPAEPADCLMCIGTFQLSSDGEEKDCTCLAATDSPLLIENTCMLG